MSSDEEIRLLRDSERGLKAKQVLENPLVVEAFEKLELGILEKWKDAPLRDEEGQRALKLLHKVLCDFRGYFAEIVKNGDEAKIFLEHERSLAARAKDAIRAFRR